MTGAFIAVSISAVVIVATTVYTVLWTVRDRQRHAADVAVQFDAEYAALCAGTLADNGIREVI